MRVRVDGIDGPNGLEALAADFDGAARAVPGEVRKVVQRGALNIKNDWRRRWSGHPHLRALPSTINYDTVERGDRASAEIGPNRERKAAALANIPEYGTVNNAPLPGGAPALETERPKFLKALEDVAGKALEL